MSFEFAIVLMIVRPAFSRRDEMGVNECKDFSEKMLQLVSRGSCAGRLAF